MDALPQTVVQVNAYDADSLSKNFQVRYLMKDGDKDAFRVNASTGEITVHRALDREKQSEYQLTIVAMDTGTYDLPDFISFSHTFVRSSTDYIIMQEEEEEYFYFVVGT